MLDESMFEDIHEIAENSAYLKAVEEKDVSLEILASMPPYEECQALEASLKKEGKLSFPAIFGSSTGYYFVKCFLIADYASDKAIFMKDVEAYKSMRFESARRKVAKLIYDRFVATEDTGQNFKKGSSVFEIITTKDKNDPNNHNKNNETAQDPNANTTNSSNPLSNGKNEIGSNQGNNNVNGVDQHTHNNNNNNSAPNANGVVASRVGLASSNTTSVTANSVASPTQVNINQNHNNNNPATGNLASDNSTATSTSSSAPRNRGESMLSIGTTNNTIGVYGPSVKRVKLRVEKGEAPNDLFDEVARDVMTDLKLDVFPRFVASEFYRKYIRTKAVEMQPVSVQDFTTFRVLGRGGFGAVHACRKKNSGTIYAEKAINKKLVKVKSALDNVLEERNVLTMMKSNFVTNLKYALQDEESLYLIMDLMLGGDLKFHLINAGRFTEKRARFYAAEVLLGLEHIHRMQIIYRDMKLENVLLDHDGHCRISDLGLAVVTKVKIKGYAGTPGYTAPEMIKNKLYGTSADIFSYGVMLYRMLCGSKPFKGKVDRDLDKAVLEKKPAFPKEIFSKEATALLTGLLAKRPENRLGCGDRGMEEIKEHPFFESIDWGLLEAGYIDPPFTPNKFDVNAASLKDIGDFDRAKYRHVKLDDRFKARIKNFEYTSISGLQDEMVAVLEKADENVNFEKFAAKPAPAPAPQQVNNGVCCSIQ